MLENGWIVSRVLLNQTLYLKISKDGGLTSDFVKPSPIMGVLVTDFSICSKGNFTYLSVILPEGGLNVTVYNHITEEYKRTSFSSSTASGGRSVDSEVSRSGDTLHICWMGVVSTHANINNLFYCSLPIANDGSATFDGAITHLSKDTTNNNYHPSIIMEINDRPMIIYLKFHGTYYSLRRFSPNSSGTWIDNVIFNSLSNYQRYVSAIFLPPEISGTPKGRIFVTWSGVDTVESFGNIRSCYSDDGVIWSGNRKLTSGGEYTREFPSISCDKDGKIAIIFAETLSSTRSNLNQITFNNDYRDIVESIIVEGLEGQRIGACSTLYNDKVEFKTPFTTYYRLDNNTVKMIGDWRARVLSYESTLDSPITVTKDEILPIISKSGDILKMLPQTFPPYKDINLKLYYNKINSLTVVENNDGGNTFKSFVSTRPVEVGDKLVLNNTTSDITNISTIDSNVSINDQVGYDSQTSAISLSAGDKSFRLENGDIYSITLSDALTKWTLLKSVNNGITWEVIYSKTRTSIQDVSITSTMNHIIISELYDDNVSSLWNFNLDSGSDPVEQIARTGHYRLGRCSVDSDGKWIYVCWSAQILSTSLNNLIYDRVELLPDGSLSTSSPVNLSTSDTYNYINPSIRYCKGYITILSTLRRSSPPYDVIVGCISNNVALGGNLPSLATGWYRRRVVELPQGGANGVVSKYIDSTISNVPNGRIMTSWYGKLNTTNDIFVSYSDDLGVTWSPSEQLSISSNFNSITPTIGLTVDGKITVFWIEEVVDSQNIIKRTLSNGAWGETVDLTTECNTPSVVGGNVYNLIEPMVVVRGIQSKYGKVFLFGELLCPVDLIQVIEPVSVVKGQKVLLSDFQLQNNGVTMNLKRINPDNYEFELNNVNSNSTNLRIFGKNNKINSLAYAIS